MCGNAAAANMVAQLGSQAKKDRGKSQRKQNESFSLWRQRRSPRLIANMTLACAWCVNRQTVSLSHFCRYGLAAGNNINCVGWWTAVGSILARMAHKETEDVETITALCLHSPAGYHGAPHGWRRSLCHITVMSFGEHIVLIYITHRACDRTYLYDRMNV